MGSSAGGPASRPTPLVAELRLTHPDLDFYVDVDVHGREGRYMATADLGKDSLDVGVGDTPQEAVRAVLRSLDERYGSSMAESVRGGRGKTFGP